MEMMRTFALGSAALAAAAALAYRHWLHAEVVDDEERIRRAMFTGHH